MSVRRITSAPLFHVLPLRHPCHLQRERAKLWIQCQACTAVKASIHSPDISTFPSCPAPAGLFFASKLAQHRRFPTDVCLRATPVRQISSGSCSSSQNRTPFAASRLPIGLSCGDIKLVDGPNTPLGNEKASLHPRGRLFCMHGVTRFFRLISGRCGIWGSGAVPPCRRRAARGSAPTIALRSLRSP